jgi:hypothetical protein
MVNSSSRGVVLILERFLIQLRLWSSVCTFHFLNLAKLNRLGASSLGDVPFSHLAFQKGVFLSSPTVTSVEQKKSCLSMRSEILSKCFHGLSLWSQLCHSHLRRRALLNLFRSLIPRPPNFFGLMQVAQLTKQ